MHYLATIFAGILTFFGGAAHNFGSTVLSTAGSDTFTTFRTNVNTSLANLNTDKLESGSTAAALTITNATTTSLYISSLATAAGAVLAINPQGRVIATSTPFISLSSSDSSLTISNLTGVWGAVLNMAHANAWTATQTNTAPIGIGSTTPNDALSVGTAGVGFSVSTTTGKALGYDATNAFVGRVSPTHGAIYPAATSTATWTGTSTPGVDAAAPVPMPFAGTLKQVRCNSNTFLGVKVTVNGTVATPAYFIASSTVGLEKFTANNTFSAGQLIKLDFGTTTTAVASAPVYATCFLDFIET